LLPDYFSPRLNSASLPGGVDFSAIAGIGRRASFV
jgi:hypothetical protein